MPKTTNYAIVVDTVLRGLVKLPTSTRCDAKFNPKNQALYPLHTLHSTHKLSR